MEIASQASIDLNIEGVSRIRFLECIDDRRLDALPVHVEGDHQIEITDLVLRVAIESVNLPDVRILIYNPIEARTHVGEHPCTIRRIDAYRHRDAELLCNT